MARKKTTKSKRYSEAEKKKILAAASQEKLTGAQVKQRFGVSTLTFYRWRGPARRRGSIVSAGKPSAGNGSIRDQVRQTVREILPGVIRAEVNEYLDSLFPRRRPGTASENRLRRQAP
ncbi:MAG: transposase [Gemmatimonadota bacterium]|nr:transposase [Gemmatimonadota bacterium]